MPGIVMNQRTWISPSLFFLLLQPISPPFYPTHQFQSHLQDTNLITAFSNLKTHDGFS